MTETNGTTQWVHTNVFANGSLIATYHDTSLYFSFEDWLGTKRAEGEVSSNGTCLNTYYSLPFGNQLTTTGTCPDATEHHFTQKERDAESGNDYFEARYYTSTFGRFISSDWTAKEESGDPVPYAVLDDPQSLNLYAYVRNNPLTRVDADGHGCNGWGCLQQATTEAERQLNLTELQRQQEAQKQQNTQAASNSSAAADPIVIALKALPGVADATTMADLGAKGGHRNESDLVTFKDPKAEQAFLKLGKRKGLFHEEGGFGPGVRLGGGLHSENARFDSQTGGVIVTSHIDRFNPNNGLGPLVGHGVVDGLFGTVGSVVFHGGAFLDR